MRRERAEERGQLKIERFIVTDDDAQQIGQYNCLGFCAGFRAFWKFPPPPMTLTELSIISDPNRRQRFLNSVDGRAFLDRVGPHFMESMGYKRFSTEPAEGPVIVMYRGDSEGPHVAKRLREGRQWYEGKCGRSPRIVHRLQDMQACYGDVSGFWVPTAGTPQKWEEEADKRANADNPSHGPILDAQQAEGELLWTMIAELEEEEARQRRDSYAQG